MTRGRLPAIAEVLVDVSRSAADAPRTKLGLPEQSSAQILRPLAAAKLEPAFGPSPTPGPINRRNGRSTIPTKSTTQ